MSFSLLVAAERTSVASVKVGFVEVSRAVEKEGKENWQLFKVTFYNLLSLLSAAPSLLLLAYGLRSFLGHCSRSKLSRLH